MKLKPQSKAHKNFLNNSWIAARKTREIVNPFNGEAIAAVADQNAATSQEVSAVVEQQTASMLHVSESSQHLAEIAGRLKGAMSRFEL